MIPLPEKISANKIYAGIHWATRRKHAALFHQELLPYRGKMVRKKEYPVDLVFIFTFKKQPLDCSNCFYMAKLLEDGLVAHGIITDDKPAFVGSVSIHSSRGKEDQVTIHIL